MLLAFLHMFAPGSYTGVVLCTANNTIQPIFNGKQYLTAAKVTQVRFLDEKTKICGDGGT